MAAVRRSPQTRSRSAISSTTPAARRRRYALRARQVVDTFAWINENGGINGKQVAVDTVDYGYQMPRAIALYKKWSAATARLSAIMG